MFKINLCKVTWLVWDVSTAGGWACEGLNQGLPGTAQPAKAADGVGHATITWPSAPVPRADLSQLWAHVRKQPSVGEFVVRGI